MTSAIVGTQERKAARVAGIGLLLMAAAGIFAFFLVLSNLVVPGDAATTASNILASEQLFRSGIASFLVVLGLDVVVAWALYVMLRPVDRALSLLAAWFRLAYAAIHGVALVGLVLVLPVLGGDGPFAAFEPGQRQALASLLLDGHAYGFLIGLVFFGFHLGLLGYLVYRSGYLPRILGVLLFVAALAYLSDSFANVLVPNYADYEAVFALATALPAALGELALTFWLLVRGVDDRQRDGRVHATATT